MTPTQTPADLRTELISVTLGSLALRPPCAEPGLTSSTWPTSAGVLTATQAQTNDSFGRWPVPMRNMGRLHSLRAWPLDRSAHSGCAILAAGPAEPSISPSRRPAHALQLL